MNTFRYRMFFESLLVVAICDVGILLILGATLPTIGDWLGSIVHALALALCAGPLVGWLLIRRLEGSARSRRPAKASGPASHHQRRALLEATVAGMLFLGVGALAILGLWQTTREMIEQEARDELIHIASMAETTIDTRLHLSLNDPSMLDSPDYKRAVEPLKRIARALPEIRYIYTVTRDGEQVRFVLDAAEPGDHDNDGVEDRSGVWEVYDDADPALLAALGDATTGAPGIATCTVEPYSDKWGTFISGYAPLRAIDAAPGARPAAVGVDVDAAGFLARLARARNQALLGTIPAVLTAIGAAAGVYTLRRRMLASARRTLESEQRFRTLVEGADVIVWEYDSRREAFSYVSPQAAALGYPLEEWLTPGFWLNHIHPEDRARAISFCQEQTRAEKDHRFQYRMFKADGAVVWIDDFASVAGTSESSAGAEATILRGVLVDITDRKNVEAALVEARGAAEDASRAKSEFLANMSHEIRTPLTAILGYTDLLHEEETTTDSAVSHDTRLQTIDTIRGAGRHLLTVINDILDLSKIEADKMTIESVETPLVSILHEVESLVRPRAAHKGIDLCAVLATPLPERMMSDPTRLRQILMNLAGNAAKFTESGSVTMTARALHDGPAPRLVVDIEDTGPGMTREQAGALFSPFSQADATVTRRHGGSGLGLTISRRLARLMGGEVSLQRTAPDEGSCFRVDLPLVPVPGAAMIDNLESVRSPRGNSAHAVKIMLSGRVLLAEDGIDNQRLISFHLRRAGAEVDVAENGRIALEKITDAESQGRPYALLVTDMQMPEMDGYSLARTLRSRQSTLPIIALTAHAMAEDRERCLRAGCNDYATKPIDKAELLGKCARWLGPDRRPLEEAA